MHRVRIPLCQSCPVSKPLPTACRIIIPSPGMLYADVADARVVVSHTVSPEDPEVWLPPSRQSSFTRVQALSDDETFKQALRRSRSSEGGAQLTTYSQYPLPASGAAILGLQNRIRQCLKQPAA